MAESLASIANRRVPMVTACRLAGLEIRASKAKGSCPRDLLHPDGGKDPAFRVYAYDAWCFSCSQFWSPVSLYAEVREVPREQAAQVLLEAIGYKPASYAHLWQQASMEREPDYGALSQALRNYCAAIDQRWVSRQLDSRVADYLASCLGYLVQVGNEQQAARWLLLSKRVMEACLTGTVTTEAAGANPG